MVKIKNLQFRILCENKKDTGIYLDTKLTYTPKTLTEMHNRNRNSIDKIVEQWWHLAWIYNEI